MKFPTLSVTAVVALVLLAGCDRPEAAWREAREQDSVAAYETFLERHGDSPQADEARQRIRALREETLWTETRDTDTIDAYQDFLERFPDGERAEEAQRSLAALQRRDEWARLRDSTDLQALRRFAGQYPDQPEAEQARQRIAELEEQARTREQARLEAERQRRLAEEAARTHRVQLAAYGSQEQASAGMRRLEQPLADALGETALEIERSDGYHLLVTAPLAEDDARRLCERLKAQNHDCLVVRR